VPFACHIEEQRLVRRGLQRCLILPDSVLNPAFDAGQNDARVDLENRWVAIPRGFESLALRSLTCRFTRFRAFVNRRPGSFVPHPRPNEGHGPASEGHRRVPTVAVMRSADSRQLLDDGRLERVTGATADGTNGNTSATALLESARRESESNPEAAYVLAYDAARKAWTALIARQGLRTKTTGHHVTVEQVVRIQFGGPFDGFGTLRRRRSEIECPQRPGDGIDATEVPAAVASTELILEAARQLPPAPALPIARPAP